MTEEKERKKFCFGNLEWKKAPNFNEKAADVMSVLVSERFLNLDFGSLDYEGLDEKYEVPKNPLISYHTRIKVDREHFKDIVNSLNNVLNRMHEEEEKKKIKEK